MTNNATRIAAVRCGVDNFCAAIALVLFWPSVAYSYFITVSYSRFTHITYSYVMRVSLLPLYYRLYR